MRRLAILLVLCPGVAHAHGEADPSSWSWSLEPWALIPMMLAAGLFGAGWLRLRRRSGEGRGRLGRQGLLFASGILVLALCVFSPLHQAGGRSFTAHMIEHELIMMLAAPLLVLARPGAALLWAFPDRSRLMLGRLARLPLWRGLTDPVTATFLQAAALWLWHAPALFELALAHEGWHIAQHLSFFLTAILFWSAVLDRRRSTGQAALCLFVTSIVGGALGAFMAVSQSPWYASYAAMGLNPFGMTPEADQQLAGVLMWVPGGFVHAIAALIILAPALRDRTRGYDAPTA